MDPDMINFMLLRIHVENKFLAMPSSGELVLVQVMGKK